VPPLDVPPHIHAIHTQPNASPARQTRSPPVVPDTARAILTADRYADSEVHNWQFGGRPS
ncbi:hypothetical protein ACWD95_32270, partial [Streptomyces sp. NPDC005069]